MLVVVPTLAATERRFRLGNAAEAVGHAESVARATVGALREAGNAAGHIGPADPAVALADGLRTYDAERVIVSRQHPGARRYLEDVPVEQAARLRRADDGAHPGKLTLRAAPAPKMRRGVGARFEATRSTLTARSKS